MNLEEQRNLSLTIYYAREIEQISQNINGPIFTIDQFKSLQDDMKWLQHEIICDKALLPESAGLLLEELDYEMDKHLGRKAGRPREVYEKVNRDLEWERWMLETQYELDSYDK